MIKQKSDRISFVNNDYAVLGLPMRLTVVIIIGVITLIAILAFILNPCLFPDKLMVTVEPTVNEITSGDEASFDIDVRVMDKEGHPVKGANVIISGLSGAGSDSTNEYGYAKVSIRVRLEPGRNQGFLSVKVKAGSCFEEFSRSDMIAVVRN